MNLTRVMSVFTESNGSSIYHFGIGMVVFGKLAQNTEACVELAP